MTTRRGASGRAVGWFGIAGALIVSLLASAAAASASVRTDAQAAAQLAITKGYRTGIAVLDLHTRAYTGAGEDTAEFASELVVKVLIAAELLATGQMHDDVETTAYRMITRSDDTAATALYGLAGGGEVLDRVASRYNISFLGSPPSEPWWWGNTKITAKGIGYLYAEIARDPKVGPWLEDAMAHTAPYGADGRYQFFGIPSATNHAAVKQGWGKDGADAPNAVFNTTGYVDHYRYAVAILTDGPPFTYGDEISDVITAQGKRLMPHGHFAVAERPRAPHPVSSGAGDHAATGASSGPAVPEGNSPVADAARPGGHRTISPLALLSIEAGALVLLALIVQRRRRSWLKRV